MHGFFFLRKTLVYNLYFVNLYFINNIIDNISGRTVLFMYDESIFFVREKKTRNISFFFLPDTLYFRLLDVVRLDFSKAYVKFVWSILLMFDRFLIRQNYLNNYTHVIGLAGYGRVDIFTLVSNLCSDSFIECIIILSYIIFFRI